MTNTRLLFVHALSPLHAGTGQSTGAIDLAIARDRATEHPCIPGSTIKGCFRDRARSMENKDTIAIFGPETANASDHAGALAFGDANLLLLPARSVAGTFAWVTSPFLLARFARDAKEAGLSFPEQITISKVDVCAVCDDTSLKVHLPISKTENQERVIFEDLDLSPSFSLLTGAKGWAKNLSSFLFPNETYWQNTFGQRFCIVHDDVMTFLSRHATDVVTRVSIEEKSKTAKDSQLWTEENLPTETILYSLLAAMPNEKTPKDINIFEHLKKLTEKPLQMGGNATVGRGRCKLTLTPSPRKNPEATKTQPTITQQKKKK